MAPRHCDMPCSVPPHPDLLARFKSDLARAQSTNDDRSIKKAAKMLHGEKGMLGMNDGTIFPRSHFSQPSSIMVMGNAALERAPLRGTIRVIVVLVEFSDVKMASGTKERMEDLWFSTDKVSTGSVNEYFSEASNGAVDLGGEVVGPFSLSHTLSYYANRQTGRSWSEPNMQTMADAAFDIAVDSVGLNLSQYDNDGNGYVDAFVVVHAGQGAEQTGDPHDLWSVKWTLPEEREADGVKVYGFLTIPEDAKCGVCAHEIGHLVFGWPDLYDPGHVASGVANWCVMGYGSWGCDGDRPVHPSAWCKANQGWVETIIETENHEITLEEVKTASKIHRLWTNGDTESAEYFLVENRQLTGFDEYLPGRGLLIWHIDDNVWNNTDEHHPKVRLIQADGLEQLKGNWGRGDAGDVFPGFAGVTRFNPSSKPNSKAYDNVDTYVSVTKIPPSASSMTFEVTVKRCDEHATAHFNPRIWYRLKNAHQPTTHCLDVINDNGTDSKGNIEMRNDGNYSGQYWQIKSNDDGTYFLRTMFLGPNRQLDVYIHEKAKPVLQAFAHVTAQYWQIKPWGDGTWHIENSYNGQYQYLDVEDGGINVKLQKADSGRPTQRWTFVPIRDITEPGY
ncbi:M6 family metalloprotease domain-containing protein [Paraphoma chrysanthemicola]|uniref:M6 family metalloprotease domain-containing protein n=1 Tax=Paraphoma chrysanthemicola TaxID=798071 RepID=A0A8K0W1C6_9PLEO|nr:M6 family metalloprotease domain-containing protein [Paraphoma chrysanthemicola]